jgi:hypothetical protein
MIVWPCRQYRERGVNPDQQPASDLWRVLQTNKIFSHVSIE